MMRHQSSGWVLILLLIVIPQLRAEGPVEPLLRQYCLGCHNDTDHEAGLSLQDFDAIRRGSENGPVLSEKLDESLLLKVLSKDSDQAMPPDGEPQPTDAEREQLRKWVLSGARIQSMAAGRPSVPDIEPVHDQNVRYLSADVSADGKVIVLGGDGTVTALKADDGSALWKTSVDGKVTHVDVAGDQVIAAFGIPGVGGQAQLLSATTGEAVATFAGHTDAVYSAVLNHDGTLLATAGYDRRILIHRVTDGVIQHSLEGHNGSIFALSFDPSGTVLCSASGDGTIKVWNVASGKRLDTLSQPNGEQYSVLVSRDGRHIFGAGADNRIRVWQLKSRRAMKINPLVISRFAHEQTITRMAMSPDGSRLCSTAEDGSINVWQTWPLQYVAALPQQSSPVTALAFADSSTVVITRLDGTYNVLKVPYRTESAAPQTVAESAETDMRLSGDHQQIEEQEGNSTPDTAQVVALPAEISGVIKPDGGATFDADCYRFSAEQGQSLVFEVNAQRSKSPLDSRIQILTTDGRPVLQKQMQAVRDSYFTFRGKDSDTSNDFRVFNWQEMELNEYLYADGEVVKLWLYPRGPDSGFNVYPGFGKRFTYFGTTPTSHALQAPCFIVVPREPGEELIANGLPVFPIYYENDDDGRRELGRDSRLHFVAPEGGNYVVRITDARGFGGPDYHYKLTVRSPEPSFSVSMNTRSLTLQSGTGREILFTAKRIDGYEGPIEIAAEGLPPGFDFSAPVRIQPGQMRASGTVYATSQAVAPTEEQVKAVRFVASADGHEPREIGTLKELKFDAEATPKIQVRIGATLEEAAESQQQMVTLKIRPGQTLSAMLHVERNDHNGIVSFGKEDSGRNLPHGLYVDNIGLNGLLLLQKQSEREFFITAAKWVPPSKTPFHLKSNVDGITSFPVMIEVIDPSADASDEQVSAR